MSHRLHDWQLRLEACLAERWAKPFEWGVLDCCLFAADCVEAVTGVDPAADFRGSYDSKAGAYRLVSRLGGFRAMAGARLGAEIPVAMAQAGDIGFVGDDSAGSMVVCGGAHWLGISEAGVAWVPVSDVVIAWRCAA